jgi:predicted esterase
MFRRQHLAIAAPGALLGAGALVLLMRRSPAPGPPEGPQADAEIVPWCATGFSPIAGGGCFAAALDASAPTPLIVYLHGRYDKNADQEEMDRQRRLAARATARGFAVLALRGRLGQCTSAPELATWFCWPSNERTAYAAGEFVDGWKDALRATEERVGVGARYVLGFSNGGFFAGLLAVRGLFPAAAFVVAHAGPVEPVRARAPAVPLLLLSADEDPSQEGMLRFDQELSREEWPHDHYARDGGHNLAEEDIDLALAFFARIPKEPLPLVPPLSSHRAHPHPHDEGGADLDASPASPSPDTDAGGGAAEGERDDDD